MKGELIMVRKFLKKITAVGMASMLLLGNNSYSVFAEKSDFIQLAAVEMQGEGTKTSPYIITDESQLIEMANGKYDTSLYFTLGNDIKLKSPDWKSIDFSGTFDGNGHTISNFKLGDSGINLGSTGLFGNNSGTVKNLYLEIALSKRSGIVGTNTGTVDNCHVSGNIEADSGNIGGIVGYNDNGKVLNSSSSCNIVGSSGVIIGGIIGLNKGGEILNLFSTAHISGVSNFVGGIIGQIYESNEVEISDCRFYGEISNCKSRYAGGIVGYIRYTSVTIKNCYNNSLIDINQYESCGDISAGGIVGYIEAKNNYPNIHNIILEKCFNKGDINGYYYAGGILGHDEISCDFSINECYNLGNINANSKYSGYCGGIIGREYHLSSSYTISINNSYSVGNVGNKNSSYTGGFIGDGFGSVEIKNSYAIGKITGSNTSAIGGKGDLSVYYNKDIAGCTDKCTTGYTTAEMKNKDSYLFWDFDEIWDINADYNDGYPYLRSAGINASEISINKNELTMLVGNTYNLTATVSPANASNKKTRWFSDNRLVASVDENGQVMAVSEGTAKITAVSEDGGYTAECAVTVKDSSYAENVVTITAGNAVGAPGRQVKVPIKVTNNKGISSFGINIIYNNQYLTPVEVTDGEVFKDNVANLNYGNNTIRVTNAGVSNKTGDGALFYVTFKINENLNDLYTEVEVNADQIKSVNGTSTQNVEYFIQNGNVQIKNIIMGDVDGDGTVTANDATEILMNYAMLKEFTEEQKSAGDVDGDGTVTANDATQVLFKYAGFDVEW